MGNFRLPLRSDFDRNPGEKWYECHLCGPKLYNVLVHFNSMTVAPTIGETITGATSLDTFVVEGYTIVSGTVTAGTAAGVIEGKTPTGYDDINLEIFTDGETITGSSTCVAGVKGTGAVQVSGRLIPESEIVEYQGRYYCRPHFLYEFSKDWEDEAKVDSDEGDRE